MGMPGFGAADSIYVSSMHYATVFSLSSGASRLTPALPARPRNGGGNGGGDCPSCDPCDATCHQTCTSCSGHQSRVFCCGSGFTCVNGKCACSAPRTACGNACTDLSSDPNNCGSCGSICPPGATCQQGGCYPKPMTCGACTSGTQTCCQQVSPDQVQCGVSSCQPICQTFNGPCTGAGGSDKCLSEGGVTQCCHSNWFYGWFPWIRICNDGTHAQGCSGPCW